MGAILYDSFNCVRVAAITAYVANQTAFFEPGVTKKISAVKPRVIIFPLHFFPTG